MKREIERKEAETDVSHHRAAETGAEFPRAEPRELREHCDAVQPQHASPLRRRPALGGERHSRDSVRQWYARLFRVFPDIHFTVRNIIIQGWPWHTSIAVQFRVDATLRDGQPYSNEVAQFIQLKWGQIAYMRLYEDTQKLANGLHIQSAAGVVDAMAAPIVG